jgi:hypothetical protein
MRAKLPIIGNLVMLVWFAYTAVDEFTASSRGVFYPLVGVMSLIGFAVTLLIAWREMRLPSRGPKM